MRSRSMRLLGCLLLAATPAPARPVDETSIYDFYEKGIKNAELTFGDRSATIRRRDRETNEWSSPVTLPAEGLSESRAFRLPGALRDLPASLEGLGSIDWSRPAAVAWPDVDHMYHRHRELRAEVKDEDVRAWRWVRPDKSSPMDLIISIDNEILAGIDPASDRVLVRRGYEAFTLIERWHDPTVSAGRFGYRQLPQAMVAMEDGSRLATLVYLPDDGTAGPYPTILIRTPYGIGGLIRSLWHYPSRGYALVVQATRGTSYSEPEHRSEGVWEPMVHEAADGRATLAWLTRKPWCDGKVGMLGGSYLGYTQWAASIAENPALRAIVPEVSMGTAFSDQPFMGGGFVSGFAYYALFMLDRALLPERSWSQVLNQRPLVAIDSFATGVDLPQWNIFFEHPTNDEYWAKQDWYRGERSRDFGSLQITGWFDDDFLGTRRNWELMKRHGGSRPQRLVIGPWKHGYNLDRSLNGMDFGPDALRDDIWLLKQRWFDHHLRGVDNGVAEPAVEYFVIGANEWRTASQWPPPGARTESWFLSSSGAAHQRENDGKLSRSPPFEGSPLDAFLYDPENPPSNWMSFDQLERWEDVQTFPYDFRDLERRSDVAVYTSEPLSEELTIAGDPMLVLYASADVKDTDWWVQVSDVGPDGSSIRLTLGMLRARFRNLEDKAFHVFGSNFQNPELLSGNFDDVVRYDVAIHAVAAEIRKGHRLRVAVMNALANYGFPNSNTGENEGYVSWTVVGRMGIHHSELHPSHLLLPVLPQ